MPDPTVLRSNLKENPFLQNNTIKYLTNNSSWKIYNNYFISPKNIVILRNWISKIVSKDYFFKKNISIYFPKWIQKLFKKWHIMGKVSITIYYPF